MVRPPPSSPPFPYTTLFRSPLPARARPGSRRHAGRAPPEAVGPPRVTPRSHGRRVRPATAREGRSEEHTSELQSHSDLVCRLLLEKKKLRVLRNSSRSRVII